MAKTDDMRYLRTEAAIRSAFLDLVLEGPIASVTATAVCQRAGISRNAFYLHHAGVQGLYATLVDELVEDIRSESLASAERRSLTGEDDSFSSSVLGAVARHEETLRALLPSDDGSLTKCLAEGIEEAFVEAALRFGEHGGSQEHRLRCAYAAWAVVGMAARWISLTQRPILEAIPQFELLAAGVNEQSSRYLLEQEQ
ncbi:MAG: TetR/AcrR family transcriptional regulator [Atopobiaceae bacterium]|nr:TetR/AcrR family transcriptional regulator [Atopobiaceae bacterium]